MHTKWVNSMECSGLLATIQDGHAVVTIPSHSAFWLQGNGFSLHCGHTNIALKNDRLSASWNSCTLWNLCTLWHSGTWSVKLFRGLSDFPPSHRNYRRPLSYMTSEWEVFVQPIIVVSFVNPVLVCGGSLSKVLSLFLCLRVT